MNYMGVDIGTSGCKAVVFDQNGNQLAYAGREYNIIFSNDGGAELNSDEVIEKCFDVIKECSAKVKRNSIKGLGITSQGEAFTAIGFDNETIHNAMVSSDIRSKIYMEEFLKNFDEEKLYQITGHTAHPMFTLFKLIWFKNNRKELWKRVKYFLCFEDLLHFKLGLKPKISWSLAGRTMMFDVRNHNWNLDILKEINLSPEKLAEPMPPGVTVGTISKKIASKLGLQEKVFVVTGGHDQTCSALGAGVIDVGVAMLGTGTVECICPVFKVPVFSEKLKGNNLCTYNYSIKDLYTTVAYSLTGGNIFKWFRDQFGYMEVQESKLSGENSYELLLKGINGEPSNLLVLPYFTPSGTPYFDTETKGAVIGLRLSTGRKEILKALLEGVSLEMRLNLNILESAGYKIEELRWVGGGASSKILAQLKANVMNKRIRMQNIREAGCYGVAMLACSADTGKSIRSLASDWTRGLEVVCPQDEYEKIYLNRYEAYKRLYKSIRTISL